MYTELYRAWKEEKGSHELRVLPKTFYSDLSHYMKSLKEEKRMIDGRSIRARLIEHEFKNAKRLTVELIQLRRKKILRDIIKRKVLSKNKFSREEETIYDGLTAILKKYEDLQRAVLEGKKPKIEKNESIGKPKKILIRFLQEMPPIIGVDMKTYGPFKSEDIAFLPTGNAKVLIEKGIAMKVEV